MFNFERIMKETYLRCSISKPTELCSLPSYRLACYLFMNKNAFRSFCDKRSYIMGLEIFYGLESSEFESYWLNCDRSISVHEYAGAKT